MLGLKQLHTCYVKEQDGMSESRSAAWEALSSSIGNYIGALILPLAFGSFMLLYTHLLT